MAIQTWPAGLNHRPLREGYAFEPHAPLSKTDMEQGPARKRLIYPNSPATPNLTWPFTNDELAVFSAWYHSELLEGEAWFWMQVLIGGTWQLGLCRFLDGYQPVLSGNVWNVTAKLEVRNVAYLDDDTLWFAGTYGPATALAIAARLHTIIHEEAPAALPG